MDYQIIVIFASIVLLSIFVLKGFQMPVASLIVGGLVLIACRMDIAEGFLTSYATGFGNFFKSYWILMFLACIFGKILEDANVAVTMSRSIVDRFGEKYVLLSIFIMTIILGFGGISSYVAIFTLYPISMGLFKRANLPRRLFLAAYFAGTYIYTGASWTVGIWNVVPTKYLGTTLAADWPVTLMMFAIVIPFFIWYLYHRQKKYKAMGLGFEDVAGEKFEDTSDLECPSFIVAMLPIIIMLISVNALGLGAEAGLLVAIVVAVICYWKYLPKSLKTINADLLDATRGCLGMLVGIASAVSFGSIITSTRGYSNLLPTLLNLGGNPLIAAAIITSVMAGVAASAGGGLSIAMPILAESFLPLGVNPEALHRVCSFACLGLDSLPHNGLLTGLLQYSHVELKEAYFDVFIISVVSPLVYTLLACLFHIVTGTVFI